MDRKKEKKEEDSADAPELLGTKKDEINLRIRLKTREEDCGGVRWFVRPLRLPQNQQEGHRQLLLSGGLLQEYLHLLSKFNAGGMSNRKFHYFSSFAKHAHYMFLQFFFVYFGCISALCPAIRTEKK